MTWYIIDTRTNTIVNAVDTSDRREPDLSGYRSAKYLILDPYPPARLLEAYKYWNERP